MFLKRHIALNSAIVDDWLPAEFGNPEFFPNNKVPGRSVN